MGEIDRVQRATASKRVPDVHRDVFGSLRATPPAPPDNSDSNRSVSEAAALETRRNDLRRMLRIWDHEPSPDQRYWDKREAGLDADSKIGTTDPNSPFWKAAHDAEMRKAASALSGPDHPPRATRIAWYRRLFTTARRQADSPQPSTTPGRQVRRYGGLCGAPTSRGDLCRNPAGSCPHH